MLELFANARAWLAAIDPALPAAVLVLLVFSTIYAVRRWLPSVWKAVEATVPFAGSLNAGPVFDAVWKTWQFLPGALLGAAVAALSAGLSVKSALWGVGSGALASLAHELMAAYRGQVGVPKGPSTPSRIAGAVGSALSLLSVFVLTAGLAACLMLSGCGLFAAAAPYLAEAAVVLSDAVNAVDAAQAMLPSLHLSDADQTKAEADIAKLRQFIAAAAAADDGAKDLTSEQLDDSLADFRKTWADLQQTFAGKRVGVVDGAAVLPVPLAVRRVQK